MQYPVKNLVTTTQEVFSMNSNDNEALNRSRMRAISREAKRLFEEAKDKEYFSNEDNERLLSMVMEKTSDKRLVELLEDEPTVRDVNLFQVTLDAELAQELAGHNGTNRRLRDSVSDRYVRDMQSGRWTMSDSMICIDKNGRLINGQHRCLAILKCASDNISIPAVVMTGFEPESQPGMDVGVKRGAAGQLQELGYKYTQVLAESIPRIIVREEKGQVTPGRQTQQQASIPAIDSWAKANPDAASWIDENGLILTNGPVPKGLSGAIFNEFSKKDRDLARMFFTYLADPGTPRKHPITNLLKRIGKLKSQTKSGNLIKSQNPELWALYITAWNRLCRGENFYQLTLPEGRVWRWDNLPNIESPQWDKVSLDPWDSHYV